MKTVKCELEISDEVGICPSGHKTRYRIILKQGGVCAFCLAEGNCDEWFGIK
ncbi:MAG: hypothetical protein KKF27_19970 [Gammaproteobacteria bacterium]|nr:hypothetical protein [Gammaproteobacteria bacterium]